MKDWDLLVDDVREIKQDVKRVCLDIPEIKTDLKHHMARTQANEDRIKQVERWMLSFMASLVLAFIYYLLRR